MIVGQVEGKAIEGVDELSGCFFPPRITNRKERSKYIFKVYYLLKNATSMRIKNLHVKE